MLVVWIALLSFLFRRSKDAPVHAHGKAALLGRGQAFAARRLGAPVEALVRHLSHELLQRLGLDLLLQLGSRNLQKERGTATFIFISAAKVVHLASPWVLYHEYCADRKFPNVPANTIEHARVRTHVLNRLL